MFLLPARGLHAGRRNVVEHALHEYEIEPAPELRAYLSELTHGHETHSLVQPQGGLIRALDARHDHMLAEQSRSLDERREQGSPDPISATIRPNVNRVFDRERYPSQARKSPNEA
jgi:hypothetical protein